MISRRPLLALPLLAAAPASAQPSSTGAAWPSRPIRFIVAFPPGGSSDVLMRLLGPGITDRLGQPVIIENRPGAGTLIGTDAAAKAAADGYTFLNIANSFTINATLARNPPFDARRDFSGVASLGYNPHVLVLAPNFAPRTIGEVVAAARAAPGRLSYASLGNGTSQHLGGESFKAAARVDIQHVPYRGAAPALSDLMAGVVPMMFSNLPEALPLVREGRLRAVAISDSRRSALLPDVPTLDESGIPGVVSFSFFGIVARAEVPDAVKDRMHAAVNALVAEPAMAERFASLGVTPRTMTRAAFDAMLAGEFDRNGRIVRDANIQAD